MPQVTLVAKLAVLGLVISASAGVSQTTAPASPVEATPASQLATRPGALTYRLSKSFAEWPADKRERITASMERAVEIYNTHGVFPKAVIANYNPGTPTADANYNGWINFGTQMNVRVSLHEISHTLGIGTHPRWRPQVVEGKWTGKHAIAQLREFDGPDAVLYADRMHFWPYGLNFDREGGETNFVRHVKMVAAFRKDLGIDDAAPR